MGQGEGNKFQDGSADRKYWVQIPQLVWALSRSSYDLALWFVVKMIAGEGGECYLSTGDLALLSQMSAGKLSECRQHLLDVGLLEGELRRDPGYPQPVWHLRIPDLWPANMAWRQKLGHKLKDRVKLRQLQKFEALEKKLAEKQAPEPMPFPTTENPQSIQNQSIVEVDAEIVTGSNQAGQTSPDYLATLAAHAHKGESWTIPFAAGGAAGQSSLQALEAFCQLQGSTADAVREDTGRHWIKELERIASFWGVTMAALAAAIESVPDSKGQKYDVSWKTWVNPFSDKRCTKGFGADIEPLLRDRGPQGQRIISEDDGRRPGYKRVLDLDSGQEMWVPTE